MQEQRSDVSFSQCHNEHVKSCQYSKTPKTKKQMKRSCAINHSRRSRLRLSTAFSSSISIGDAQIFADWMLRIARLTRQSWRGEKKNHQKCTSGLYWKSATWFMNRVWGIMRDNTYLLLMKIICSKSDIQCSAQRYHQWHRQPVCVTQHDFPPFYNLTKQ